MNKNKKIKIFSILALVVVILSSYFISNNKVHAQGVDLSGCTVLQPEYRHYKPGYGTSTFYQEDDRPIVYVDIHTQNCFDLSNGAFSHLHFSLIGNSDNAIDALDDYEIVIGGPNIGNQPDFTIAFRTGEENCNSSSPGLDCQYYLRVTGPNNFSTINFSNIFQYDCDGGCLFGGGGFGISHDWDRLAVIPLGTDIGGPGGNDTYGPGNNGSFPSQSNPNQTGGGSQNSTTTTPFSPIIDLNITNPLAGTVDSLPQLFQQIVEIIIKIAIPLIAIAIVYSGLLFVTARGDTGQLDKARHAFTFAIIGGLVLLASWLIAGAIKDALTSLAYVI